MLIQIAQNGYLEIKRDKAWKGQLCPFGRTEGQWICGDWCPQFGEPYMAQFSGDGTPFAAIKPWRLPICQGKVLEGQIEDLRDKEAK